MLLKGEPTSHSNEPLVGDHVTNDNPGCKHFGSEGVVTSVNGLPDDKGKTVTYTVVNNGGAYSAGDTLTKTLDQVKVGK